MRIKQVRESSIKHRASDKGLLYTKMKVFHFKDKLDSLPKNIDEIMPPIHIRIKPTNVCNHNCWYCAYKSKDLQLGKDMVERDFIPRNKMLEIVEDISEMGVKAVTFSGGGEPFCYPYLYETVESLVKHNISFAALTNGSLLKGKLSEIFAKEGTWLRVSMDGSSDQDYSKYRGTADGEFTKIISNMESFKKFNGKCFLGVSLVVDKNNYAAVYKLIKRLKEIGADSVKVSPCIVSNDRSANNNYHQPIFDQVKSEINKSIKDFKSERFEIFDAYHELDDTFTKDYDWCPYLQILPVIGADLNIYPCQDKAYNLDEGLVGSIKDIRFKDFWFSDKNNFFKINPASHCNHHCVANAKNKLVLDYLNVDKEHLRFV
ncbi:MAG: radical SAM protein [Candidatus Omnitrophota bacterium]